MATGAPRHGVGTVRVDPTQITADGADALIRGIRSADVAVVPGCPDYSWIALENNNYVCSLTTAVTAAGTALSATPMISLANYIGNRFAFNIHALAMTWTSGTFGLGSVVAGQGRLTTVPASTLLHQQSIISGLVNSGKSSARLYGNTSMTNVGTPLFPVWSIGAHLGTDATVPAVQLTYQVDGALTLMPGAYFGLWHVGAAGSTPTARFAITWEEVPLHAVG